MFLAELNANIDVNEERHLKAGMDVFNEDIK